MLIKLMKKLLLASLLLISVSTYAETTECDGRWENSNQQVHVKIDWSSHYVYVNDAPPLMINKRNEIQMGFGTNYYTNKFGQDVYFFLVKLQNEPVGIAQVIYNHQQSNILNDAARLSCTKLFLKNYSKLMIGS